MNYPIWLAYASGVLEESGHTVRLVDAIARKWDHARTLGDVEKFKPEMIIVDTNFSSVENDIGFAVKAKNVLDGKPLVTAVGPPAAKYSTEMLRDMKADVVVRKEFEFSLAELAEEIQGGGDLDRVLGISYGCGDKIIHNSERPFLTTNDLDSLPFVSKVYKKHLDIHDYWLDHTRNPMVQIITSRGCPNLCTFCSWPENLHGRHFRPRSANNVVDEIEWILHELPEVKEIFFEDDSFTVDTNRVSEFCREIRRRDLEFTWSCQSRPTIGFQILQEMKKAGCRLVDVGFESGSDLILKNIKKGVTVERTRRFAADARKANLMVLADFVFGFPGESNSTIEETKKFIKEIRPSLLQIAIATPIPGTEFREFLKSNGYLLTDDLRGTIDENGFQKSAVSYPGLSSDDLEAAVRDSLRKYYLSTTYAIEAARNIILGKGLEELKSMLISAKAFIENSGLRQ